MFELLLIKIYQEIYNKNIFYFLTYLSFLDIDAQITLENKRMIRNKKILPPNRFEIKHQRGEDRAKIERTKWFFRQLGEPTKRLLVVPR